jgi:drug/metabolite transporter (DMT)-like permease
MLVWFLLRRYLGWSGLGVVIAAVAGVVAVRGFGQSLGSLSNEPPPRAGRLLVFAVMMGNGLLGALGGLFALVSFAASLGSCFDYAGGS